jgi:hypothetical protein
MVLDTIRLLGRKTNGFLASLASAESQANSDSKNNVSDSRLGPATKTMIAGPALLRVNHARITQESRTNQASAAQKQPPGFTRNPGGRSRITHRGAVLNHQPSTINP